MAIMTASEILDAVPPSVQMLFFAIGVICLIKKFLDWIPLLFSFILPGTNVRPLSPRFFHDRPTHGIMPTWAYLFDG